MFKIYKKISKEVGKKEFQWSYKIEKKYVAVGCEGWGISRCVLFGAFTIISHGPKRFEIHGASFVWIENKIKKKKKK